VWQRKRSTRSSRILTSTPWHFGHVFADISSVDPSVRCRQCHVAGALDLRRASRASFTVTAYLSPTAYLSAESESASFPGTACTPVRVANAHEVQRVAAFFAIELAGTQGHAFTPRCSQTGSDWRETSAGVTSGASRRVLSARQQIGREPDPLADCITAAEVKSAPAGVVSSYRMAESSRRSQVAWFGQEPAPASCSARRPVPAHSQRHHFSNNPPARTSVQRSVRKSMHASSSPPRVNSQ
jgi:hypothetical protein